jgi:EmrB/QacA subfamily drug resistance transporter
MRAEQRAMGEAGLVSVEPDGSRTAEPGPGSPGTDDAAPPLRRGLALLVAGGMFMEILDGTVIGPAAPHIAADLGVPAVAVNVAVTAYVLTLAVLIPVSGWLADRLGARTVFVAAVTVFTLASAGCALAPSLGVLTATRVVQGIGGAMMVPVGRLVVLRTTAKPDLIRAIAYLTWPALVAPVLAPALGGVLSTYASWRWIFLINVPLGIAGAVLGRRLVPGDRGASPRRLDGRGFVLTAVGVAALVVGLESVARPDPAVAGTALGVAVLVLAAAIRHLRRSTAPLLDVRVLRIATYRVSASGGSVYRAVISAIPFLLPLLFQLGFGWTAAQAGLAVIALFVGNIAIKPATTPLMRRFGIRSVMLGAIVAGMLCLAGMALLSRATPLPALLALLLVSGVARSVGFTAYNSVAFADVPAGRMSSANTLFSTLQELGGGLGVAVGALLVRLGGPVSGALGLGDGAAPFRVAFALLAVILMIPIVEALRLPRGAGAALTGRG